jgi:hypothetical protein
MFKCVVIDLFMSFSSVFGFCDSESTGMTHREIFKLDIEDSQEDKKEEEGPRRQ